MDTVHVCPERDIECGSVPLYWCATCPKVEPWEARLRASAAPPPAADAVSEAELKRLATQLGRVTVYGDGRVEHAFVDDELRAFVRAIAAALAARSQK